MENVLRGMVAYSQHATLNMLVLQTILALDWDVAFANFEVLRMVETCTLIRTQVGSTVGLQ